MSDTRAPLGVATNCHQDEGMADWERLARYVTARRIELNYRTREAVAEADPGIKPRTLGDIERASRTSYNRTTIASLEHALQWRPGSVQAILDGGEPTAATTPAPAEPRPADVSETELPDDALIRIMRSDLPDPVKAQIVRTLLAEQRRFAQHRADELLDQALSDQR